MSVERFPMYSPTTGAAVTTTPDPYELIWKPRGWRKSPKAAEKATKKPARSDKD